MKTTIRGKVWGRALQEQQKCYFKNFKLNIFVKCVNNLQVIDSMEFQLVMRGGVKKILNNSKHTCKEKKKKLYIKMLSKKY